jgi:sn1-specific diacylglycerol lipase
LKQYYPDLKCIVYGPSGELISKQLAEYTKTFILNVILGDDIIPRLSIRSINNLKNDILKESILIIELHKLLIDIFFNFLKIIL